VAESQAGGYGKRPPHQALGAGGVRLRGIYRRGRRRARVPRVGVRTGAVAPPHRRHLLPEQVRFSSPLIVLTGCNMCCR
jgi:hypothetical protein